MEENEFYAIETFGSTGRGTYEIVFKGSSRILAGCLSGLSRDLLAYDFLQEVNGTCLHWMSVVRGPKLPSLIRGKFFTPKVSIVYLILA